MAFQVREGRERAGDRTGEVLELVAADESVRAEVWPHWGFNCLRWQVRQSDGRWADILYAAADWETNPVPTRSGHPILFPFPGRLGHGTLVHEGRRYTLPANDATKSHAIHGFTPRYRWRFIEAAEGDDCAAVTGEFRLGMDLPDLADRWPADFALAVTYRLYRDRLRVEARVRNLGPGTLPFGLGYHPYFRLPGVHDPDVGGHVLQAHVTAVWEAVENLPTGRRGYLTGDRDFRQPRPIGTTPLDDVFTGVGAAPSGPGGMAELAVLSHPRALGRVRLWADPDFRELVLFTPPHRQAVAIEPYTCSADAANLALHGIDSGWKILPVGGEWAAAVEYRWEPIEV